MRRKRRFKIDEQFFIDFINNDLEVLEQMFSEEQLLDIANQLNEAEPQNFVNSSQMLDIKDALFEDNFSDVSI